MDARIERELRKEIKNIENTIPLIHRGGCGIFAALLWDMLAFHGYYTEPVEVFDGYPNYERSHVLLKYDGRYIDSLGIHYTTYWMGFSVEHALRLDELKSRAWDDNHWLKGDGAFDRKNILKLKKAIHQLGYNIGSHKKRTELKVLLNI